MIIVICTACKYENPNHGKFCLECGEKLQFHCISCLTNLPPDAKFCLECGTPVTSTQIRPSSPTLILDHYIPKALVDKMREAEKVGGMQNERRIVTMLFCDLQGSTAAAEQMDPEEWVEIMNGAFEFLIEPVYRYEGVIARLMGDAILAFFGAPIAHEDDPERAVLSGLEIIKGIKPYLTKVEQQWGVDVNVRVGINTGLVVVGEMGSDLRVEYTAMGDAINLASRMESTAQPGTLQVTEYTYKLIEPLFEFEKLGLLDIKGKTKPIHTYRVIQKKEKREQLRGLKGLDSPLIGRDEPFDIIMDKINAMVGGKGQIVSLIAEAGLGKSRLVRDIRLQLEGENKIGQFNNRLEPDQDHILWLEGASLSYQTETPYAPFKLLLTKYLGIEHIKHNDDKYRKLKRVLVSNNIDEEQCPFIAKLLDIIPVGAEKDRIMYLDPPILRSKIFEICSKLFSHWCNDTPLIIVFDDIHWLDNSSMELLKSLFFLAKTGKIIFLLLFRPRREDISWRLHEYLIREYHYIYTYLELKPLDHSESRFLIFNILKIEGLSERIRNLILDKSEGNPFFLEEVIRSLIDQQMIALESGHWKEIKEIDQITIPDTVAGVLTTRLDQLDEHLKRTLQTAAVVGREFQYELLLKLIDDHIALQDHLIELEKRELIISEPTSNRGKYSFKHPLTQEVAYNSLLLKKRRALHSEIAHNLEITHSTGYNEIAHHYYEAREFDHALPFLIKSGDKAFQSYSTEEAIQYYKKAESLITETTDVLLIHDLYQGLGQTYLFIGQPQESIQSYNNLLSIAEQRNHVECKVNAHNQLGFVKLIGLGEFDGAIHHLQQAEEMAKLADYQFGIAQNYMIMCNVETATAQFDSVEDHLKTVAEIGEQLEEINTMLYGRSHITNTLYYTARFDQTTVYGEQTIQIAKTKDNKAYICELYSSSIPMAYYFQGKIEIAWNLAKDAYQLSSQISLPIYLTFAATTLTEICLARGHFEEAQNYIMIATELSQQLPIIGFQLFPLGCELYFRVKFKMNAEKITEITKRIETVMEDPMGAFLASKYWYILGMYYLNLGQINDAEELFNKVLQIPGTLMYIYEPYAKLGLISCYLVFQKLDRAATILDEVSQLIEKRNMQLLLPEYYLVASKFALSQDQQQLAISHLQAGISVADTLDLLPVLLDLHKMLYTITQDLDPELSGKADRKANEIADQLSQQFVNDDLRQIFLQSLYTGDR